MNKRTAAALLVSTSVLAGAAVAQTTIPATTTTPGTAPATVPAASDGFVTDQATTEFRASKFVGLDVYGTENEKIGDIGEILIDRQGNARAVVIGVGGFLGIGQKTVAVAWSAVSWSNGRPASRSAVTAAPMTGGVPAATGSTGAAPAGSSGSPPAAAPARGPDEQAAYNGYPDHATVKLTKAQLQDAPAFRYYADTHAASGTGPTAPSSAGPPASTPRQ